jgi:hypothetical protein
MSRKADAEKKEKEQAAAAIDDIEKAARKGFEADQKAAREAAGKWTWVEDSQYYYNAKHRCAGRQAGRQGCGRCRGLATRNGASLCEGGYLRADAVERLEQYDGQSNWGICWWLM